MQNFNHNKWNTHIYSEIVLINSEQMFSLLRFNLYLVLCVLLSLLLIRSKSTEYYYKEQRINIIVATQGSMGGDYLFCRVIYLLCGLGK